MQGKIISFNHDSQQGLIIADDGIQYTFNGHCWVEEPLPKAGDNVVFTFDTASGINNVSYVNNQTRYGDAITDTRVSLVKDRSISGSTPPALPDMAPHFSNSLSDDSASYHSQNHTPHAQYQQHDQHPHYEQSQWLADLYEREQGYNLIDWTKKVVFENYANFQGRARRKEYWLFGVGYTILSVVALIIDMIIGTDEMGLLQSLLGLAVLVPSVAVTARRLHDTNRSGWWQLLWFIPIIGWILLIIWLASDTEPQDNKWGAPARNVRQ